MDIKKFDLYNAHSLRNTFLNTDSLRIIGFDDQKDGHVQI